MLSKLAHGFIKLCHFPRQLFAVADRLSAAAEASQASMERVEAVLRETLGGLAAQRAGTDLRLRELAAQHAAAGEAARQLQAQFARQADRLESLGRTVDLHARLFPSWPWTPETAARVRAILALLGPMAAAGIAKTRVGRDRDGGYVMLDDFADIAAALSIGIGDDASWDADMAARGIEVLQFDPSVAAPPSAHPLFRFEALRLAPHDQDGAVSLATILRTHLAPGDAPLVLKIDIEGGEWEVFRALDTEAMGRFRQIVCEFHGLERLGEDAFGAAAREVFGKLAETHFVCHVHGNNCGNFANVANLIVPQTLEVCFALRTAYTPVASTEVFPTALDRPNEPGRADLYLGPFRFGPPPGKE